VPAARQAGAVVHPFLKWAGGKRQLLPELLARFPSSCETYFEPFVGSGAMFFALSARRGFRRAVLSDRNRDLIAAYQGVRDRVEEVIGALRSLPVGRETFYRLRAQDPDALDSSERAARLIYLNRTCYNGLYRVNRAGRFNVPFGRYEGPRVLDAPNLRAVSAALQGVEIVCADFGAATARARRGDALYFDPPYVPLSPTSRFTSYDSAPFGVDEQVRLASLMIDLARRGVFALLSNAGSEEARALYGSLPVDRVSARRAINSRADRRGPVAEILVRTLPGF
jgi:DNA adenine methylase